VGDIFDDNLYAHDPSEGFVNFAFNSMGALDYAADAWGYTNGVAVEWRQNWWTARAGTFQLSTIPNGQDIEPELFRQYMAIGELEGRYELLGQPGEIKLLAFGDNGNFAKFRDVNNLALMTGNLPPDVTSLRNRHFKPGGGINIEQKIIPSVSFFMRASLTDGRYQTVDSADVDHQISAGVLLSGGLWQRNEDTIGLAAAASRISGDHARYFALGGRGTYVGDGALSYAGEKNFEAFYKLGLNKNVHLTFDYQLVANPGYNSARGPVNIFGVRLRAGF
jgi:high affinity Mn2+ porin